MRINTDGNQAWRDDLYERTADVLDENTKTGAIDSACIHTKQDIEAKRETIEYLTDELPPGKLEHVADLLTTDEIEITVETTFSLE